MDDLYESLGVDDKPKQVEGPHEMGDILEDLSAVLEREIDSYSDLLEAARSEQQAIIYGKLKELKLAIEAEENLIASTRALDEVRQNVVALIAKHIGCDDTNLTLKEIIERVEPEHREKLNSLRNDLQKVTKDLESVNRANAQLIKSSIEFINETVWILLHSNSNKKPVYDSTGRGHQNVKSQVLVDKLG